MKVDQFVHLGRQFVRTQFHCNHRSLRKAFTHEFKHDDSELSVSTRQDAPLFLVEDRLGPLVLIQILLVL